MKNLKRLIIFISVIILIIGAVTFFTFRKNNVNNTEKNQISSDTSQDISTTPQKVTDRNLYYAVKTVVNKYFLYVKQYHQDEIETKLEGTIPVSAEEKQANFDIVNSLYDKELINKNQINEDTIKENIEFYKDADNIEIENMLFKNISSTIQEYIVNISLWQNNNCIKDSTPIIVKIDTSHNTFSIMPENCKYKEDDYNFSDSEISEATYNKYDYTDISDETIIEDFLDKYKSTILHDKEKAYNLFDKEYREKRFGDFETFSKFIDNNIQDIAKLSFTQYLTNDYDTYKEYVCKDKYQNLYIFNETSVMDYTIMLDTYTLDNKVFLDKYYSSSNQTRVALNIDKWIQMLNCRDYRTAFYVLDESFRKNYFNDNVDDFEAYMRNYFPDHYSLEYGEFTEEAGTYIQKVTFGNNQEENSVKLEHTIYMELGENTDFRMSFDASRH